MRQRALPRGRLAIWVRKRADTYSTDAYLRCGVADKPPNSSTNQPERAMNKDRVKGTGIEMAGKAQAQAGKAVGSKERQVKGHVQEAEGQARHSVGDARKLAKDATKKL